VFLKSHLLDDHAQKLSGARLFEALKDKEEQEGGNWSPVGFPVRFVDDGRLLVGNYVIDAQTSTVLLEFPPAAAIGNDNSLVASWTETGELEICDMSFWRAYQRNATEPLRPREQLLLRQIGESDKSVAAIGSVH
jgi:hypothetical protein